ncbi:MAG: Rab family GTPase [Candidatus Thorarchaeota archaeon]
MSIRVPVFKTVLIGEGGVGKTSLAVRYTEDRFDQKMKMTIGVNFATKKVRVGGTDLTLLLWDLGGQPRFQEVISDYFIGSKLGIAVYDVGRIFTLHKLRNWITRLHKAVPSCEIFLVGNKIDERIDGMGVTLEDAQEFAVEYNARVFEVSAKTGNGVFELFDQAGAHLARKT